MEPQVFEIVVNNSGRAEEGQGVLAAYIPGTEGSQSIIVMACDPRHEHTKTINELAPAAMAYVKSRVCETAASWCWALIDSKGQFIEALPEWRKRGNPLVRFEHFVGGVGIDAFLRETGAAGEAAMELLSTIGNSPSLSAKPPGEREFLESIELQGKLPATANIFGKLDAAIAKGDEQLIAAAIQADPVLSLSLIHSANGGSFAAAGRTASVPQAVNRLGLSFVRRFVFVTKMMARYHAATCPSFNYRRFALNSLATGAAMKALAPTYGIPEELADDAFTTGLVAGIGWLATAETFPVLMAAYVERCQGADPIAKSRALREIFPCSIRMVSERYLERYSLPPMVMGALMGRRQEDRAWFDCLSQAMRVSQALAPFECRRLPTTFPVPEVCREDWEHWKRALSIPS